MPDVKPPNKVIPDFNFIQDPKFKRELINTFELLYNYIDFYNTKLTDENIRALSRSEQIINDKLIGTLGKKLIGDNTNDPLIETINTTIPINEAITAHKAESDPHTGYQLESEKAQANGYAPLNTDVDLPVSHFPKTSSNADPSLTEYPNNGDGGIHLNTTSGLLYLSYNNGGVIVKVQLT
jgi:hypothetical protein